MWISSCSSNICFVLFVAPYHTSCAIMWVWILDSCLWFGTALHFLLLEDSIFYAANRWTLVLFCSDPCQTVVSVMSFAEKRVCLGVVFKMCSILSVSHWSKATTFPACSAVVYFQFTARFTTSRNCVKFRITKDTEKCCIFIDEEYNGVTDSVPEQSIEGKENKCIFIQNLLDFV